jgi:hypothetical protein
MTECRHQWEMANIKFGFVVFEKCYHCNGLRTYFSVEDSPVLGDKYREGSCFWSRVENAQSFRFDVQCKACGHVEKYDNLMGLMHCTGCMADCEVDIIQRRLELEKTWVLVAFGFIDKKKAEPILPRKLEILTDHFNQHRDISRSKIKIISYDLIKDLSRCRGDFMHDVGMLSQEAPAAERKLLF